MAFLIIAAIIILLGFIIGHKKGIGVLLVVVGLLMIPISIIVSVILTPLGLILLFAVPR